MGRDIFPSNCVSFAGPPRQGAGNRRIQTESLVKAGEHVVEGIHPGFFTLELGPDFFDEPLQDARVL
jgi:hypothetical protein